MNNWKIIAFYHGMKMWCLFAGAENGYIIEKVFSSKMSAILYSKAHGIKMEN